MRHDKCGNSAGHLAADFELNQSFVDWQLNAAAILAKPRTFIRRGDCLGPYRHQYRRNGDPSP